MLGIFTGRKSLGEWKMIYTTNSYTTLCFAGDVSKFLRFHYIDKIKLENLFHFEIVEKYGLPRIIIFLICWIVLLRIIEILLDIWLSIAGIRLSNCALDYTIIISPIIIGHSAAITTAHLYILITRRKWHRAEAEEVYVFSWRLASMMSCLSRHRFEIQVLFVCFVAHETWKIYSGFMWKPRTFCSEEQVNYFQ